MHTTHRLANVILGLLVMGCAATSTGPTQDARQALAPTGKFGLACSLGVRIT